MTQSKDNCGDFVVNFFLIFKKSHEKTTTNKPIHPNNTHPLYAMELHCS